LKVLLLNASEEVLNVIDWKRAVNLLCSGRAEKPYGHEDYYRIPTPRGHYELPTAIVLVQYVNLPYRVKGATRKGVFRRDKYECQYCGCSLNAANGTVDHVMPVSRGGKFEWKNLVASCRKCNYKKANRTPQEAKMPLAKPPIVPNRKMIVMTIIDHLGPKTWSRWVEE
jgi:5-methylcytosine-specific restriction endonuclease McrA